LLGWMCPDRAQWRPGSPDAPDSTRYVVWVQDAQDAQDAEPRRGESGRNTTVSEAGHLFADVGYVGTNQYRVLINKQIHITRDLTLLKPTPPTDPKLTQREKSTDIVQISDESEDDVDEVPSVSTPTPNPQSRSPSPKSPINHRRLQQSLLHQANSHLITKKTLSMFGLNYSPIRPARKKNTRSAHDKTMPAVSLPLNSTMKSSHASQ